LVQKITGDRLHGATVLSPNSDHLLLKKSFFKHFVSQALRLAPLSSR